MSHYDILIKNGTVFDGRRNPRYMADIGIKDGFIAKIGNLPGHTADRVIDAGGLNVAPGFMDLHTHYDSQLFWDPYCSTSGWHGITSVVIGNCGFGFAPVRPEERERAMLTMTRNEAVPLQSMKLGMPFDWVTFPEFLESVERTPKSVNILAYVPLNPLMVYVMGQERSKAGLLPTEEEHAEMARLLNEAMDAVASGFSIQRMGHGSVQRDYDGTPMATDIMHDETALYLARVLAERGEGVIQYTYVDFEQLFAGKHDIMDTKVRPHIEEIARISRRPVIVGGAGEADLDWVRAAQQKGLRIYAQAATVTIKAQPQVTNIAEAPNVFDVALNWCQATVGTVEEVKAKFADPKVRQGMREQLYLLENAFGPMGNWVFVRAATPRYARYDENPLSVVAKGEGYTDLLDAFCDINIAEDMKTMWMLEFAAETLSVLETHREIARDPYTIPGISDGGAHTKYATSGNYPTRYLMDYVREHGWHTLEEAHWRLSALPAFCAGFNDRGTLVEGAPADIVIYDFDRLDVTPREMVHDYPGNEWRVIDHPVGYHYTIVNGEITVDHGQQTNIPSGKLLRGGRAEAVRA